MKPPIVKTAAGRAVRLNVVAYTAAATRPGCQGVEAAGKPVQLNTAGTASLPRSIPARRRDRALSPAAARDAEYARRKKRRGSENVLRRGQGCQLSGNDLAEAQRLSGTAEACIGTQENPTRGR